MYNLQWSTCLLLAYLITFFDGTGSVISSNKGSRSWFKLQQCTVWEKLTYLVLGKVSIVCKNIDEITKVPQAIVASHPHGVLSFSHVLVCTDCIGYMKQFPQLSGDNRRNLVASVVLYIPFLRDILLWWGFVDAGRKTAITVLEEGKSIFVIPGGEKEQLLTKLDEHVLWITNRKGFCRLAVQFGIPIIPHYTFGETGMYDISGAFFNIRWWICDKLHIAILFARGRWYLPFPFCLPHRLPNSMNLCIGSPIYSPYKNEKIDPKINKEKFNNAVNQLHGKYLDALCKLFNENKAQCGYPNGKLVLLP